MVGGFGRNYWFALFVVGVCNHCCEGTYLASPTPFEEEACQILTAAASATSWHLCKAYPESSATVVLASRLTSPTPFYNGVCGMALPLQAVGSSQWSKQKLLQQLWGTLHGSEVVAPNSIPWSFCQQETAGKTASEEYQGTEGLPQSATFRNRRFSECDCSSLGDEYSYQNGLFATSQRRGTWRNGPVFGGQEREGREDFGERPGGGIEADPHGEGYFGCRGFSQAGCDREDQSRAGSSSYHPQNGESTPESREDLREHQDADRRVGREVESVQRSPEDQVPRAGCTLQGQEETACDQECGDKGKNHPAPFGDPEGSGQDRSARDPRGVLGRTGPEWHGDRSYDDRLRRRTSSESQPQETVAAQDAQWGSRQRNQNYQPLRRSGLWINGLQDGRGSVQDGNGTCRSFHAVASVALYLEEDCRQQANFTVPLMGLQDWEDKPWALHGGAYLDRVAHMTVEKLRGGNEIGSTLSNGVSGEIPNPFDLQPELHPREKELHPGLFHRPELRPRVAPYPGSSDGDQLHQGQLRRVDYDPQDGIPRGDRECDQLQLYPRVALHPRLLHGPHAGDREPAANAGSSYVDESNGETAPAPPSHDKPADESRIPSKASGTLRESGASTTSTTENEHNLNLYMFGLQGGYLGRRDRQIRLQGHLSEIDKHAVLQRVIRETWPDFINDNTQYFIPVPQPDPEEHGDGAHLYVLVNFLARQLSQHNGLVPVLFEAKGWDLELNLIQHTIEAAMVPERAHWSMLSSACGLHQQCLRRHGNQCTIRIGSFLCINDDWNIVPDGSMIKFNFDITEDFVNVERLSLLQHGRHLQRRPKQCPGSADDSASGNLPSSSSQVPMAHHDRAVVSSEAEPIEEDGLDIKDVPHEDGVGGGTSVTLHMFHRHGDYKQIAFRQGNPFHERAQVANGWGVEVEEIIGIHPIRSRPRDLSNGDGSLAAITRWTRDADYRIFPTDIQCLFDVELHSGQLAEGGPKIFRHVDWTRRLLTREGLLHRLWVGDFCRLIAREACLVWHNNDLWQAQDYEARRILAGDYFRVAIPARPTQPINSIRQFLRATEQQVPDHTMFPSSPETSMSDQEDYETSGSEETQYGPPPLLPEPEPHDVYDEVCRYLQGWLRDRNQTIAPIQLHGLCGTTIGACGLEIHRTWSPSQLAIELAKLWTCPSSMKVRLHEVHPQPQPIFSKDHHFIIEFIPITTRKLDVMPTLHEAVTCGQGGVPQVSWQGVYVPSPCGRESLRYLNDQADYFWIDELRPLPDQRIHFSEGQRITSVRYAESPLSAWPEESRCWPRIKEQFPTLLHQRDSLPARSFQIVAHFIGGDYSMPAFRSALVQREHCSMPGFLLQLLRDLWPEHPSIQIEYLPCRADVGHLHFAVSNSKLPELRLRRVQIQGHDYPEPKIAFYKACYAEDLQSSPCGLHWLGLGSSMDVDDVSIRHETNEDDGVICFSVDLTSIETAASTATCEIMIADLLTDTFKPHGQSAPIDGRLDFSEVINLGAWLDSAMVRVSWILPTGCEWKESSLPWVDAPWWDYEQAEEIHIYTDGSAYKGSSSCAAVLWIYGAETWYFGGYVRHLLPGRSCPHRAELHGILLGCHWLNHALQALHVLYGTLPSVKFHFDSTSAGYKAFGQWGGTSFGDLVGNIRSVSYYIESRYKVALRYEHVKEALQ